jgi:toxin ParE1/3/4
MAGKFSLRYLPAAVDDLTAIFDWIAADNPARAGTFLDQIDQTIRHLESHPFLGRIPRDEKLQNFGYRVLVIEAYLVFYLLRGKAIEIHRIIYGSRNLADII